MCAGTGLFYLKKHGIDIAPYLRDAGHCTIPSIVDSLTLIDGDRFEPRNALRQSSGIGGKLTQGLYAINNSMVRLTYLRDVTVIGHPKYVTPMNVEKLIPLRRVPQLYGDKNMESFQRNVCRVQRDTIEDYKRDSVVLFLGVDNMATRHDLCMYARRFDNILLINGGNETTFGDVTVYERRDGKDLDPNPVDLYDNLRTPTDTRPDQAHCTDIAPSLDQTVIVNTMIATVMLAVFDHWLVNGTLDDFQARAGNKARRNHVLVNTMQCSMHPMLHQLTPKEETNASNS